MEVKRVSIPETLRLMQDAVKRGCLPDAMQHGAACVRPLSLTTSEVTFGPQMSSGAESRIFKGVYHSRSVAIKKPIIRTSFDLERFRDELRMMTSLDHPSIVSVLGACALPPNYFMILSLENRSYYDALYEEGYRPDWPEVMELGRQLSSAMEHVHDRGIVHRDIKTRNVLRGTDGKAKLIDFGIAKELGNASPESCRYPSGGFHKRKMVGTLEYMAPEVLQGKGHVYASDVYAFAVTLNEIACGIYPFSDCNKENPDAHTVLEMGYGRQELAAAVVAEGLRPTLPSHCPSIFADTMRACWELNPSARPSFSDLHALFVHICSQYDHFNIPARMPAHPATVDGVRINNHPASLQSERGSLKTSPGKGEWLFDTSDGQDALPITCGVYATAGFRGEDRMEDRHLICTQFMDRPNCTLLGVFDGHRGSETSQFAVDHFGDILCNRLYCSASAEDALSSSFLEIESLFEATASARIEEPRGARCPGCTALAILIHHRTLYIANAGDCRAVLCRGGVAQPLTRDHTAMDDQERIRVQRSGTAFIHWRKGSWRIGKAGIQVTRSLGDMDLKQCGVSADPEVLSYECTSEDSFVILGSDGLWDVISNEEAVQYVHDTVKHPDMCAKRLVTEALTRGSQDNITVIVAFLKPVTTLETIFANKENLKKMSAQMAKMSGYKRLPRMAADEMLEVL